MTSGVAGAMRAWRLARPRHFELIETPVPRPSTAGDVVLRTIGGAICGSDLPYFDGAVSTLFDDAGKLAAAVPGYPLHEVVGRIVHSQDPDLPVGSVAVGWATRSDALAEMTLTQSTSLLRVPDDMPALDSLLLQPLACVLDTLRRIGRVRDRDVAIIGLGGFGLLFAHAARSMGAARITGIDPVDRSDVAAAFCLDEALHCRSDRWAAELSHERPNLVIEAVGHQTHTLTDAIMAARPGATIFAFGVPDDAVYPLPMEQIFRKGLTLSTGIVLERRQALQHALGYVRKHPDLADRFFTHTLAFENATEAFELASRSRRGQVKVRLVADGARRLAP